MIVSIILLLGELLGFSLFATALVKGLWLDPVLLSPQEYQTQRIAAHPIGAGEFPPDLAWPLYMFRQAGIDRRRVFRTMRTMYEGLWRRFRPRPLRFRVTYLNLIALGIILLIRLAYWGFVRLPVIIILGIAGLSALFCYGVYWVASSAISVAACAAAGLVLIGLRGAEAVRRTRRHSVAACTRCFHVTPWPAYRCPACRQIHHDVRPGRLGLLYRRCGCGTRLPTMASRAAWRMAAVCKRTDCQQELPEGTGAVPDIRVPVFGDTSAGKTRFLFAALNALLKSARRHGTAVSYLDQPSQSQAELGLKVIRSAQDTAKTSATVPVVISLRLGEGRGSSMVHLFDAAGEHYRDAQRYDTLRFLDHGQGLVYVLDPFSVGAIRNELGGHHAEELRRAHAAAGDPEIAFGEVVSRLRDGGVPPASQRLAVVVSKADLLRGAGLALPSGSQGIADWLAEKGMHNLVMAARRDFAEARYFTVASQDSAVGGRDDPGAPLHWLLTAYGARLPAAR